MSNQQTLKSQNLHKEVDAVCYSLSGIPRYFCYYSGKHDNHDPLTLLQAIGDLKRSLSILKEEIIKVCKK